jgi:hypothetical protein
VRHWNQETRAFWRDSKVLAVLITSTRVWALKEPIGSLQRQTYVALNRGLVTGSPMWSWWKNRRLREIPDEESDTPQYHLGMATGEFLAIVVFNLASSFRHTELANPAALSNFSMRYAKCMTLDHALGAGEERPVLEWIHDRNTMLRAHAAATHDAEASGVAVGERIELEFLRELSKRTGVPMPADAAELIAERRRDSRNLPTGVEWAQMPESPVVGGPQDGAVGVSPDAAKEIRRRVRDVEREVILDVRGDGATVYRGILAGLTATDHVPLLVPAGTDPLFHRNRLCGSLEASLIRSRGRFPFDLMKVAYPYARVLMSPQSQAMIREPQPDGILKVDAWARYFLRRDGANLDDADALAFFNWLAEQADVPVTPTILARRERFVVRPASPAEEPPETPGASEAK